MKEAANMASYPPLSLILLILLRGAPFCCLSSTRLAGQALPTQWSSMLSWCTSKSFLSRRMAPRVFWSLCVHPNHILEIWSFSRRSYGGILELLVFSAVCFRDLLLPGHLQMKIRSEVTGYRGWLDSGPSREGSDFQIICEH